MSKQPVGSPVTIVDEVRPGDIESLLDRFGLMLGIREQAAKIPGSYWGAPEAGIAGRTVYVRPDTPLHSLLHETCHIICMTPRRRVALSGDAGGDDLEESAVCYLQILLADFLPGFSKAKMMRDMDAWGYSFRLGSTRGWFDEDSADARLWLERRRLIDSSGRPTFLLRAA